MAKLTPESPRLFRPTLAAWIGLNESIFLEQLNFIITETDKGQFADGKKWYRDTPRAFMIQYFPFWDESIVKRTIANLRADALILVRSDLNDDSRDRSLWYTINYPALERLDGPVARITGKSEKRKEARKARKTKPDNYPDYAKVQNVPLSNEAGTNSTSDNQQNVLLPPVQIVPTPKESLILEDSKTKNPSPYGEGGKPAIPKSEPELELPLEQVKESPPDLNPPIPESQPEPEEPPPEPTKPKKVRAPKPPAFEVYTEKTEYYSVTKEWVEKMAQIVGEKPEDLARWGDTITTFTGRGKWKGNVQDMLDWYVNGIPDYSKKGQPTNGYHGKPTKQQPSDRAATYDKAAHDAELESQANPRPPPR